MPLQYKNLHPEAEAEVLGLRRAAGSYLVGFGARKLMVASNERMPGREPSVVVRLAKSGVQPSVSVTTRVITGSSVGLRPVPSVVNSCVEDGPPGSS